MAYDGLVSLSRYIAPILFSPSTSKLATHQCYIGFSHLQLSATLENLLPFLCWHLWLTRNEHIFKNQSCSQNWIIHKVVQCATEFFFLAYLAKKIKIGIPKIIKCNAPSEPFIKLNTDGSSLGNPRLAGAGGLLRNSLGAWISGFSLHMGITSNNIAELGAVRQVLLLA